MLVFGPGSPYGHPVEGFPGTVERLTREDLSRFHDIYWKPGGAALIFAGDISMAEAKELANSNFGSWAGSAPAAAPAMPSTSPANSAEQPQS